MLGNYFEDMVSAIANKNVKLTWFDVIINSLPQPQPQPQLFSSIMSVKK